MQRSSTPLHLRYVTDKATQKAPYRTCLPAGKVFHFTIRSVLHYFCESSMFLWLRSSLATMTSADFSWMVLDIRDPPSVVIIPCCYRAHILYFGTLLFREVGTSQHCYRIRPHSLQYMVHVLQYRHRSLAYFSAYPHGKHLATCLASGNDSRA